MSFHAEDISNYNHESLSFGIDKTKTVTQLRKLADEVEAGWNSRDPDAEYIVFQGAETKYEIVADDYAFTTITLKFATKKGAPPFMPKG
jgi:hypothetical protein